MEIKEALEQAKSIAKGFMEDPVELDEVFLFYWDLDFDRDEPNPASEDAPIVVVYKDGSKSRIETYATLDESIKKQLDRMRA